MAVETIDAPSGVSKGARMVAPFPSPPNHLFALLLTAVAVALQLEDRLAARQSGSADPVDAHIRAAEAGWRMVEQAADRLRLVPRLTAEDHAFVMLGGLVSIVVGLRDTCEGEALLQCLAREPEGMVFLLQSARTPRAARLLALGVAVFPRLAQSPAFRGDDDAHDAPEPVSA